MRLVLDSIQFRLVELDDAEYIYHLRSAPNLNQHLSATSGGVEKQRRWLVDYKQDEADRKQFYFIIQRLNGTSCGTVRLYDFRDDSFCWGSWILDQSKTLSAALESAVLVYRFGFNELGFCKSHFDVRKENKAVIKFHKRFGAVQIDEDRDNYYFELGKNSVNEAIQRFGFEL